MAYNPSHRSSSTLTTNSDLADFTNSGRKFESISRKFHSRTPTCKFCHHLSFPLLMDYQLFFQELVHAKHHIGPYTRFEGWEDPKLWDTLAFRVGVDMCVILRDLKLIKNMYSLDNTLSALDYRLKINALIVFGSEQVFVNLAVDIMEKVLRENGALPFLPLTPHPMNEPTDYPGSDSGENNHVTCDTHNPSLGDRVNVDMLMVETEQEQMIIPSPSSSRNKNFMNELGYSGAFSRRYGEDLESLNLNGEQITNLLTYCPPDSSKYHAIADLSPHLRRETLLAILKKTSDNISKISSSSCLTKRKRYKLRYEVIVVAKTTM